MTNALNSSNIKLAAVYAAKKIDIFRLRAI